ncbi:hypothetical protein GCM10011575_30400 [Microlunatus endophyticus]|uniref:Uncharacterized protein n=1 Tax=Microlunatus endophyticus TaxID=1716077 RepID=A0A917SD41_9ACTN|nr:hypothetical protein GCM10011575_30400 [Microlunatus endophyticus]
MYELLRPPQVELDLLRIQRLAETDPANYVYLFLKVDREITGLQSGEANGYHALGYEPGKGDLRDSVTCYIQSDPHRRPDYRLVFREMPPECAGGPPRRELIAVRPRRGPGNIYEHVLARLHRHPDDLQPGLGVFGMRRSGRGGNELARQAELAAKRAIALAFAGQVPLSTSRPIGSAGVGLRAGLGRGGHRPQTTRSPRPGSRVV